MNVTDNANDDDDDDDDNDDDDDDDIDAKANLRDTDLEIFSGFFSTEAEKQLWGTPQPNNRVYYISKYIFLNKIFFQYVFPFYNFSYPLRRKNNCGTLHNPTGYIWPMIIRLKR